MLLTTVSYSRAVCVFCVCVEEEEVGGGGGRQPVQFKGKIQGAHTQSWERRQARQQEKGSRKEER